MDKTNLPVKMPSPIVIYDGKGNPVSFAPSRHADRMVRIKHVPPAVQSPVLGYRNYWSRDSFQPGEYDLAEISRAADTDSYLARAFKKKTGLLMKEGYRWVGKNQNTIKYIKRRIAQIERATSTPFKLLLREVSSDLIKFSNAFIVKVRDKKASGGAVRKIPSKTIKPVAGYFRVPPETMFFKRDPSGRVIKYQQKVLRPLVSPKSGKWPEWDVEDVIHIYHDRKGGFAIGTPDSVPVLDDVRVLRRMEEDVELLVYQHLFPLYHYIVGTENAPAQTYDTGVTEVDVIRQQVEDMPAEGCLVTPERHDVKAIGAQGKALKADPFLEHFKKRVWAGLAMSAIDYGEGSTANRNTADALSAALIDCVKDFQQVMELFVDFFIVGELLLESTFQYDVLDDEHSVHLQFNEIDLEAKIKRDANAVNLYQGHVIGLTKARKEVGEEPIEADEEKEMFFERVEKPRYIIQAIDEPYTAASKKAMASASAPSSPKSPAVTSKKVAEKTKAPSKGKSRGGKAAGNTTQPTNQHGTNPGPTKRKSNLETTRFTQLFDAFKEAVFLLLFRDLLDTIKLHDHGWRKQMGRFVDEIITQKYLEHTRGYFYRGLRDVEASRHASHPIARVRIKELQEYASRRISWLTDKVLDTIESLALQGSDKKTIRAALDSFAFRADFLDRTVKRQSRIYGQAIGLLLSGHEYAYFLRSPQEEDTECTACDKSHGQRISLEHLVVADIPPWHDNCECQLSLFPEPTSAQLLDFTDAKKKKKTYDQAMHVHPMPTLDNSTTGPADDSPNHTHEYNDGKQTGPPVDGDDGHIHVLEEGPETGPPQEVKDEIVDLTAKEERCVIAVKPELRKRHPTWSSGRVKSSAIAICRSRFGPGTKKDASAGKRMNSKCLDAAKADLRKKYPKLSAKEINGLAQELCKMHALDPAPTTVVT